MRPWFDVPGGIGRQNGDLLVSRGERQLDFPFRKVPAHRFGSFSVDGHAGHNSIIAYGAANQSLAVLKRADKCHDRDWGLIVAKFRSLRELIFIIRLAARKGVIIFLRHIAERQTAVVMILI